MEAAAAVGEPALVFIGFMGAGKTTAGRAAAAALGARAVDADDRIEERLGHPIAEHFATHGEASFRAVEEEVVRGLLDAPPSPVLALGGGAVSSSTTTSCSAARKARSPCVEKYCSIGIPSRPTRAWSESTA